MGADRTFLAWNKKHRQSGCLNAPVRNLFHTGENMKITARRYDKPGKEWFATMFDRLFPDGIEKREHRREITEAISTATCYQFGKRRLSRVYDMCEVYYGD